MTGPSGKTTRAQEVYDQIRDRLLTGELEPGSKLKLNDFVEGYGVSLSVVREAVTRLAGDGLVQASPQRGFAVMSLTIEELIDLTRARVLIETMALAESIKLGTVAWEAAVIATHHELANTPMLTPEGVINADFTHAHRAFHDTLLAGCGSSRLQGVATELRACSELYQSWSQQLAHDDTRDVACEHRTIAELTVARDEEGAVAALRDHIERTTAALVRYAEEAAQTATA
ncbi:GntR family transcriptional regulator [Janibacter sp. G1551]|jgi:DNA-binding GntR family transcriptional regulator|uniref:GntR family transcriptional regulator n=1 Tax=Janibacter sp. G1551 TaxID=3420440 RepID=UPI003CFEE55A